MKNKTLPEWTSKYPGLQYYECTIDKHNKYWAIYKQNINKKTHPFVSHQLTHFWGRIGNQPQTSARFCHDLKETLNIMQDMTQDKINKGYKLVGTVPSADNPPLSLPQTGKVIKAGQEHDVSRPDPLGNIFDYLEID